MKNEKDTNSSSAKGRLNEPFLIDYVAGGFLSGGIAWMWSMALNYLPGFELLIDTRFLYFLSIVVYVVISFLTSFFVSKRFEKNHIVIGLKTSLFSWVGIIITLSPLGGKTTDAAILFYSTLFFCMILGGYLGGSLSSRYVTNKTELSQET